MPVSVAAEGSHRAGDSRACTPGDTVPAAMGQLWLGSATERESASASSWRERSPSLPNT